MTATSVTQRDGATRWFLARGVPAVLERRERWSNVLSRSAPGLAAYLTLMVVSLAIAALAGSDEVNVDEDPTPADWVILALLVVTVPMMTLAGWAVSRLRNRRLRRVIAVAAVVLGPTSDLYQDGPLDALTGTATDVVILGAIVLTTASGLGSVLGWGVRTTLTHLASAGRLAARALPIVLLTVLAFFNAPVWSMAANLSTDRFWLLGAFMAVIAVSFLVASLRDRVSTLTAGPTGRDDDDVLLADSPFQVPADPRRTPPLSRAERANLLFVAVASQIAQIVTVALVTMGIFLVLGLILLSPGVLRVWTGGHTESMMLLDIVLPVPLALAHVTLFLGSLTFMYLSARAVSDAEHRADYLDPLFEHLRLVLVARDAYRAESDTRVRPPADAGSGHATSSRIPKEGRT